MSDPCIWSNQDPLWPAGHLPHKGGETKRHRLAPPYSAERAAPRARTPHPRTEFDPPHGVREPSGRPHGFSPLVGEMAGRPEGVSAASLGRPEGVLVRHAQGLGRAQRSAVIGRYLRLFGSNP